MATPARQTAADLTDVLIGNAKNYDFFRLLEHLHEIHGDNLETTDALEPERHRVRLSSYGGLGFPASDVLFAGRLAGSERERYEVRVTFFGMHGPDSPLPAYYVDRLAYEYGQGVGIRPAFMDFFHHRLLTLLHQAWRKYRYYVRFRHEAQDHFSRYVFGLIGLGDTELRGATPLPWGRLLSFAGQIASRSRSPQMVAGIVAHCFDLQDVKVREYQQRYVELADQERVALGRRQAKARPVGELGESFVIGGRVRTRHSKFILAITGLSQQRFREFLPRGESHARLRRLMDFLLRDPAAYDIELGLREEEVPSFNLGRGRGSNLGWTSFLEGNAVHRPAGVRIKVRP